MNKAGYLSLLIFVVYCNSNASIGFTEITVDTISGDSCHSYELTFNSSDKTWKDKEPTDNGTFIIHIKFEPACITDLVQSRNVDSAKVEFFKAIQYLKQEIKSNKKIVIGLRSGIGCRPIQNRKGEYISYDARILNMQNRKLFYLVHSDVKSACKN